MGLKRSLMILAAIGSVAMIVPSNAGAKPPPRVPEMTMLASFGSGLGSGSSIGPGRALYVTDGNAGSILRIDPETGDVSTFADGLPRQVLGIGGPMDVAFIGQTAYVLVTLVGGDIVGGPHIGDATVGIYRLEKDGSFTVIADIGEFSVDHPPTTDFFITTGVQYAVQVFRGGFLVTDGHHNRVLRVTLDGDVSEFIAFGNIVPTGLEISGNTVYMGELGPVPHRPDDGKVVAFRPRSSSAREVANGASMIVDVERGRGRELYALSQGDWDGVGEGSPALPDTGRLVTVGRDGSMTPVVDGSGEEIVLDRPTSLEFIGNTAYIVTLIGEVFKIDNVSSPPHGRSD